MKKFTILIFTLIQFQLVDALTLLVTKEEAVDNCADQGYRLFHYSELQTTSLSAWIEEYAMFSKFMFLDGCYKRSKNLKYLRRLDIERSDLYTCSTLCSRDFPHSSYIGIQKTFCFCMTHNQKESANNLRDRNWFCGIPCINNVADNCGGENFISIYRLVAVDEIIWAQNYPSSRQCVMATSNNSRFELSTATCFAEKSNGYLCKTTSTSANCDKMDDTSQYCLMHENSSRNDAFSGCLNKNGTLIGLRGERRGVPLMKTGFKYWIGLYRAFELTNTKSSGSTICLAVTKYDKKLFLDPDSCVSQKKVLCRREKKSSFVSNSYEVNKTLKRGKTKSPFARRLSSGFMSARSTDSSTSFSNGQRTSYRSKDSSYSFSNRQSRSFRSIDNNVIFPNRKSTSSSRIYNNVIFSNRQSTSSRSLDNNVIFPNRQSMSSRNIDNNVIFSNKQSASSIVLDNGDRISDGQSTSSSSIDSDAFVSNGQATSDRSVARDISQVTVQFSSTTNLPNHVAYTVLYSLISTLIFTVLLAIMILLRIYKKGGATIFHRKSNMETDGSSKDKSFVEEEMPFNISYEETKHAQAKSHIYDRSLGAQHLTTTYSLSQFPIREHEGLHEYEMKGDTLAIDTYDKVNFQNRKQISRNAHEERNVYDSVTCSRYPNNN